ncbi:hypothetical protein C6988_04245 [Nitrosopumilus sp. b1]|uniref:hypothetical protein n=1 Tax=Nitrosopumilus sp. b1 TaxID=2109907 RepID=UPI0015F405CD|nr:hypothetical protein [Nitrosopumilus sp. b1]KAF6243290.1 hypothetical protein C6988_04245 [Nitrosopumilus sp. b1]
MASCSGCGEVLGFKKYKFHKMWRISGYYCKKCMLVLGKDFDEHGKITLTTRPCDLCNLEFYFLKSSNKEGKHGNYCDVCHKSVASGVIPKRGPSQVPTKLPLVMMIFAGLGIGMMGLGLVFTLMTASGESSLLNILFGATTTALGFVLFKKTMKSRSLLISQSSTITESNK